MPKEKLTEEQLNQVLNAYEVLTNAGYDAVDVSDYDMEKFASAYGSMYYNHLYTTPYMVNEQMKNTTIQQIDAAVEDIEKALKNPKSSEDILRNYSTSLEIQNMYYKRLIQFVANLPAWNFTYYPVNEMKDSEFKSKQYKEDVAVLETFMTRFNCKEEFGAILREVVRQGVYYGVLRDDGYKYTMQELPPDFCIITGRHPYGLLFDFDFQWFLNNYGVDINMYPKVFKKMYRETFKKVSQNYNPSQPVDTRSSTFVYWHQCSPEDGFWAFKIQPEIATITPFYAGIFPAIAMEPEIRKLQESKYMIAASKLLVGIIGFNKDNKSGNGNNQINLTPDVLGKFLGVARQGLSKEIGLVALPMEDVKAVEFDTDSQNILDDYNTSYSNMALASANVLLSTEKLNVFQAKLASAIDENFVTSLYPMFENFVEYFVNKQTKKYKFKIKFNDVNTPDNRALRLNNVKAFAGMGIVDWQDVARVFDENPFEFRKRLAMSKNSGMDEYLTSLISLNNQSSKDNPFNEKKRGRPSIESTTGSTPDNDNTAASIDRGSNELAGEMN